MNVASISFFFRACIFSMFFCWLDMCSFSRISTNCAYFRIYTYFLHRFVAPFMHSVAEKKKRTVAPSDSTRCVIFALFLCLSWPTKVEKLFISPSANVLFLFCVVAREQTWCVCDNKINNDGFHGESFNERNNASERETGRERERGSE